MSASGRKAKAVRIQFGHHQHNEAHAANSELEDVIAKEAGVTCSVKVLPDQVKIRAANFRDYVLAASVIRGRVSAEIVQG